MLYQRCPGISRRDGGTRVAKRFVSIGECMIEMSGGEDRRYRLGYAGDTLNTAWYARAQLPGDWRVDYVTAVGDDPYSREMLGFFDENGIGTGHIRIIENRRPGLYLIHQAGGDRQFTYWRDRSAAKLLAEDGHALAKALIGADLVYFSGITLAILDPRSRGRLFKAIIRAREAGARVAFDPNERPALWSSQSVMASSLTAGATVADIVLPTYGDEAPVFGDKSPRATAERYLAIGAEEVAVKNGGAPAFIATRDAQIEVAPPGQPRIVDATAAGDSFNGTYLAARLQGRSPAAAAEAAHRVAGIKIGHSGALIAHTLLR